MPEIRPGPGDTQTGHPLSLRALTSLEVTDESAKGFQKAGEVVSARTSVSASVSEGRRDAWRTCSPA